MSLSSHLSELRKKHEALSKKIETELRHPAAEPLEIAQLKRQKLQLKDEIARLAAQSVPA